PQHANHLSAPQGKSGVSWNSCGLYEIMTQFPKRNRPVIRSVICLGGGRFDHGAAFSHRSIHAYAFSRISGGKTWPASGHHPSSLSFPPSSSYTGRAAAMQSFTPLTSKLPSRSGEHDRNARGAMAASTSGKSKGTFFTSSSYLVARRGM